MSVFAANNTALITGGASGIGLAVAQLCRKHGMRVAIADLNKDTLAQAHALLGADNTNVSTHQTDVSQPEAWETLKAAVSKQFGSPRVDFLMLNAGIGLKGGWDDRSYFEKARQKYIYIYIPHSPSSPILSRPSRTPQKH